MIFYAISAFINFITSLLIGLFVIVKKRSEVNWFFSFFSLSVAFWSFSYFQWQIAVFPEEALYWCRILTIGSIFIPIFYYKFTLVFLDLNKVFLNKLFYYAGIVLVLFLLFVVDTKLLVVGVSEKFSFDFWPEPGILYPLFLLMFSFFALYSMSLFIGAYKKSEGVKKEQIKLVLFGTAIGFLGGSTNFLLWYDIPIVPVGNVLVSFYVFFVAYAIVAHHLMDIRLVLRKSSVYLMSLLTIFIPIFLIKYFITVLFSVPFSYFTEMINFIILIFVISFFSKIKEHYYSFANRYFFSSLYDGQKVIADLSEKLKSTLRIKNIYTFLFETINSAFHINSFGVLLCGDDKKSYKFEYKKGIKSNKNKFLNNKELYKIFLKENNPVVLEEAGNIKNIYKKKWLDVMRGCGAEVIVPLVIKNKLVGLMVLGRKKSGDMYNNEDVRVLKIMGSQAAIAIENSLLYEEMKDFNKKLEQEVKISTFHLRVANDKLRKLDEAKSEFISIASHQLRTPLTVIKGYVSMILGGSFGDISGDCKESLSKVYASNERLINLVEDLLDISRMEAGSMQFNFEKNTIDSVTDSVIDELTIRAKQKKLKLLYKKPKTMLNVMVDKEKLSQVVMNLVENSIKYTSDGYVSVEIKNNKDTVEVSVSDSGMGIKREYMSTIFNKFSRSTDSFLIDTEGTGLGLYIAKQIILAHKGNIWAESDGYQRGSKFCFQIPIC